MSESVNDQLENEGFPISAEAAIRRALTGLEYESLEVVVHDSTVLQIKRRVKSALRIRRSRKVTASQKVCENELSNKFLKKLFS